MKKNRKLAIIMYSSILFLVFAFHEPLCAQTLNTYDTLWAIKSWQDSLYSGYSFKQWISLGDPMRAAARSDRNVEYEIKTAAQIANALTGANLVTMPCYRRAGGYYRKNLCTDSVWIKTHPNKMDDHELRGLWHETIHAILIPYDKQVKSVEKLIKGRHGCDAPGESFTYYMEAIVMDVLRKLSHFETEYNKGFKCNDKVLQTKWDQFKKELDLARNGTNAMTCGIMEKTQLDLFQSLVGFDVDEQKIEDNYKKIPYRTTKDGKFVCPYSFKIIKIDAKDKYGGRGPITLTAEVASEYNYRDMKPKVYFAWDSLNDKIEGKTEREKRIAVTETNSLELTNVMDMKPGTYNIRVRAYQEFEEPKTVVLDEASHTLIVTNEVSIQAPKTASVGDTVSFAVVTDVNDTVMPALKYAWRMKGSTQVIEDKKSFTKRVDYPGTYEFSVVVYQTDMIKKQSVKLGEAKHTMVVGQGAVVDIIGPAQTSIGENVPFTAKVTKPETDTGGFAKAAGGVISSLGKQLFGKDIMGSGTQAAPQPFVFEWYVDGVRTGGSGGGLNHSFTTQGNHTVRVVAYEDVDGKPQKIGEKSVSVLARKAEEAREAGSACEIGQRYGNYVKAQYDFFNGNVKELGYPNWPQYLGLKTEYLKKMGHDPGESRFEGRYEVPGTPVVLESGKPPLYGGKYIGVAIYHVRISKLNGKDDKNFCQVRSTTPFISERTQATTKTDAGEAASYVDGHGTRWTSSENIKKTTLCHNYPEAFYEIKAGKDYYRVGDSYKNWNTYNKNYCSSLFFQERTTIQPSAHYKNSNVALYDIHHQLRMSARNVDIDVSMTYSGVMSGYHSLKFNWSDFKDSVFAFVAKLPKKDPAAAVEAKESSKEKQKKKK